MQFLTLDDKKYNIHIPDYKIKWAGKSASKFEFNCKKYFFYIWRNDIVLEEMLIRPYLHNKYRVDLINISKKIACEFHGKQHIEHVQHYHKTEDDFWKSVERDTLKKECLIKNGFSVVEIYPNDIPISLSKLKQQYPNIRWPFKHPKENGNTSL